MKIAINLSTKSFIIRTKLEVKKPLQKKNSPTKPKQKPSYPNNTIIINQK